MLVKGPIVIRSMPSLFSDARSIRRPAAGGKSSGTRLPARSWPCGMEDTVVRQFHRIATDHHVEQQLAIAQAVESHGLSCCKGRQGHAGPRRHHIFEPLGYRREALRGNPGLLAILSVRQQNSLEPEAVGCLGNLFEKLEIGLPLALARAQVAAVAMGRDEPEKRRGLLMTLTDCVTTKRNAAPRSAVVPRRQRRWRK